MRLKYRRALSPRKRRHVRVRAKVAGTPNRPRLNVFRSSAHMYCQVIDDVAGHTIVAASDLDLEYRDSRLKHWPAEVVLAATFKLEPADPATIAARLDDIRRWRREHQPLGIPSAGSTFRNPPGDSAGRIIDSLGLKGRRRGGAAVSEKHANFIVNDQKGSADDVIGLIEEVSDAVRAATGVRLVEEVVLLGERTTR